MEWISVKNRLPEKIEKIGSVWLSEDVIGFDGEYCYRAYYNFNYKKWYVVIKNGAYREDGITHWIPLPKK